MSTVKTVCGLALASMKTWGGLAAASVKTILGQSAASGPTGTQAIASVDALNGLRNDLDGIGMRVVPTGNISITALGLWKNASISGTKTIRVYANDGTTVLASASVVLSGDDAFSYVVLGTPLSVTASTQVFIFADVTNGVDSVYLDATVTPAAGISVLNSLFRQGGAISNFQAANHNGGPVDFYFT